MTEPFKVALIQTNSEREFAPNIAFVEQMARRAHAEGAAFITTPEIVAMFEPRKAQHLEKARPESDHPALAAFQALAADLKTWFLVGSLSIKLGPTTMANRSYLVGPTGEVVANYDKIHMFDVDLAGGERYRESETYKPGERAVTAELPWGRLGMTVCYDLRFPQLYRTLAQAGADFLTIPAAFTRKTGMAHWHVLMRARAIETGCFVIAPAQCGTHAEGRQTYGHSLVVAPWGEVLADGGEEPGVTYAEIDPAKVAEARGMVPSLRHDRSFAAPSSAESGQEAMPRRAAR
jgi:predicted amidohydrolase